MTWQDLPSCRLRRDPDVVRAIGHIGLVSHAAGVGKPVRTPITQTSVRRRPSPARCGERLNPDQCRTYWEPCHRCVAYWRLRPCRIRPAFRADAPFQPYREDRWLSDHHPGQRLPKCRMNRPDRRPRSITKPRRQKPLHNGRQPQKLLGWCSLPIVAVGPRKPFRK